MKRREKRAALLLATIVLTTRAEAVDCRRDLRAEAWLAAREAVWVRHLAEKPGFEPSGFLRVCRETGGGPYLDGEDIHLPPLPSDEERLSLAHEYLHRVFRSHPVSRNEVWIERTARSLVLGEEEP
ncbi:MAG: DUF2300 domain-containing protein [Magnetococcales bacterium]|nr:DUF2300 domain-containing protein [Magnetococcales bacterium]